MEKLKRKKRKKQNRGLAIIEKSILRIVAFILIIGLNWTGLSAVLNTFAYFNDTENSLENTYQAGSLDFSLRSGQNNFVPTAKAENMKPGDTVARDIYIKKEGSLPFKYNAKSEPVDGLCDLELYNALQLKVWYNWYDETPVEPNYHKHRHMDLKYDGPLKNFDLRDLNPDDPDLQIPNSHLYFENVFYGPDEHWFYSSEIILPEAVSVELQNKSCKFEFVFEGWQTDLPDSSSGFTDTEKILSTIATGDWSPEVTVTYPNGGEVWYLVPGGSAWSSWCLAHGMNDNCEYPIRWTAVNKIGDNMDLLIDIYFSTDSGSNWMPQIISNTENDGIYWWKPPYDMAYVTSHARIKVTATHKVYPSLWAEDMSEDFCPPMLTLEDLMNWEEPAVEEPVAEEISIIVDGLFVSAANIPIYIEEDNETVEEIIPEIEPQAIEEQPIEEVEENGSLPVEEVVSVPDEPITQEEIVVEETPAEETPVIEEQPAIEEQPIIAPDNSSEPDIEPQSEPESSF